METRLFSKLAEMEAIKAEVLGMVVANEERASQGLSFAHSEEDFQYKANELRTISIDIINLQ